MGKFLVFLCLGVSSYSAYADLVGEKTEVSTDRLGELTRAVQGSYEAPNLQVTEIKNDYMMRKYGAKPTTVAKVTPVHPKIGMTKKQVLNNTTWGMPTSVRSSESRSGVYEYWLYGNRASLTFKNGILEIINRY